MLRSGIIPNSRNYNLLLRTARDCGIGDPSVATDLLLRPEQNLERKNGSSGFKDIIDIDLLERQLLIQADPGGDTLQDRGSRMDESYSEQDQLIPVTQTVPLTAELPSDGATPNLLDIFEDNRCSVISLGTVSGASDRLTLIGGAMGLLEKMEAAGLSPDLRTLTLLADMMESGHASLQALLNVAKKHKVKLDVAFFNSAIRRAARAGDREGATVHNSLFLLIFCDIKWPVLSVL